MQPIPTRCVMTGMPTSETRSHLLDVVAGFIALTVYAAALFVANQGNVFYEYSMIVLPAVVFPLVTWLRVRAGSSPWFAFFAVNVWLILADGAIGKLALANFAALLFPMIITVAASAAAAFFSSAAGIASVAIAAAIGFLFVPQLWESMLTSSVDTPAPDVTLQLLDGSQIRLADLHGNVVVLNFWGTWCVPCVRELPELAAFARDSRTARVMTVNSGIGGEKAGDITRFMRARHLNLSVAYDPNQTVYRAFAIPGVPTTVIIDPQGIIRERRVGFAATASFETWLSRATRRLGSG